MNKIFLFAILTGMFAASCTDHFAEYNSNPMEYRMKYLLLEA